MSAVLLNQREGELARSGSQAHPRPRVLHFITSFDIGGTERQAAELLKRLDAERYDLRLAVLRNGGSLYQQIADRFPDPPEFRLNSFYDLNAMRQLSRLCALMKRERIDILHAHDFYSGVLGCAAARLSGVRAIASQRHLKLSDRRAHEIIQRLIHRMAHKVLVNSDAIRQQVLSGSGAQAEKIVVIKNGLLVSDLTSDARLVRDRLLNELKLNQESFLIGLVARLEEVKGHSYFIEAAARVVSKHPQAHFVLVGDGELRQAIENQIAELNLAGKVHLLGYRDDAALLARAFDLSVLTSLHEGLPNSVMEAMSAGIPVVATDVGGTRELITDCVTGFLVPPADSTALAERINRMIEQDQERALIAARGREFVLSNFGMSRMVSSVERLYDSMMRDAN